MSDDASGSGGYAKPLLITIVLLLLTGAGGYVLLRHFDALPFSSRPPAPVSRAPANVQRAAPQTQAPEPRQTPLRPAETRPTAPEREAPSRPAALPEPLPSPDPGDSVEPPATASSAPPDIPAIPEDIPAPTPSRDAETPQGPEPQKPDNDAHHETSPPPDSRAAGEYAPQPESREAPVPPPREPLQVTEPRQKQETGATSEMPSSEPPRPAAPVIEYGKGSPARGNASVSRGTVPKGQRPADTSALYGTPGNLQASGASPQGQDPVVPLAFFDDLARFLVSNYWPEGSHPLARGRGVTTAGVALINMRYGGHLQGFAVNTADPARERRRILRYLYVPSMLRALYGLYSDRFFAALARSAEEAENGRPVAVLSDSQRAEMFGIYKNLAADVSSVILAYSTTPGIRNMISAYTLSCEEAAAAYERFSDGLHRNTQDKAERARSYQASIKKREQASSDIAALLRKKGPASGLDDNSVVYAALWLYRRGAEHPASLKALAGIFSDCSTRLSVLEKNYASRASRPR